MSHEHKANGPFVEQDTGHLLLFENNYCVSTGAHWKGVMSVLRFVNS